MLTKRARVAAALARQPVDRPPVSFWHHVPEVDHTARGLAEAMLSFQRRWDLDLDVLDEHLAAVVGAVKSHRAEAPDAGNAGSRTALPVS